MSFDIYKYLESRGCYPRHCGSYIKAICPIHKDADNPSAFVWWLEDQRWKCFTRNCCEDRRRDARALVAAVLGVSRDHESVLQECDRFSGGISASVGDGATGMSNCTTPNVAAPAPNLYWCDEIKAIGYTKQFCRQHRVGGLQGKSGHIYAVAFLVFDRFNTYVGYTKRILDSYREYIFKKHPERGLMSKWVHSKGFRSSMVLYGEHLLNPALNRVIVTESPKDTTYLIRLGFQNVVGTFGLGLKNGQISTLIDMGFENLIFLNDNDEAGVEYYNSKNYKRVCGLFNVKSATHLLPDGLDPDNLSKNQLTQILC